MEEYNTSGISHHLAYFTNRQNSISGQTVHDNMDERWFL